MAASYRRRVRGDRAFKKLLTRLPAAVRDEMVETLQEGGVDILEMEQAGATVSKRERASLTVKVLPGALQLKVGLVGRPINRRLWWAKIIERGRKAQIVSVTRLHRGARDVWLGRVRAWGVSARRKPGDLVSRYQMRVRALAPHPAVYAPQVLDARNTLGGKIVGFWERTLTRASAGVTDD